MSSFHVNAKGEPGRCSAKKGNCPFGGAEAHHDSAEAARAAYERANGDAAVPPPARANPKPQGQLPFLDRLDAAYNDLVEAARRGEPGPLHPNDVNRESSNHELEDIETAMEDIVADHRARMGMGAKSPERQARREEFKKHWRKSMLDQLENRTGEQLPDDTPLVLPDGRTVLNADGFGAYTPGEYPATYVKDGNHIAVKVAVYEDGTSRAFLPDYRDDLEHRQSLVKPTRQNLAIIAQELDGATTGSDHVWMTRQRAVSVMTSVVLDREWETPEQAAAALDTVYDMNEGIWEMAQDEELSEEDRAELQKIAEKIDETQDNAYVLRGRQSLPPLKQ